MKYIYNPKIFFAILCIYGFLASICSNYYLIIIASLMISVSVYIITKKEKHNFDNNGNIYELIHDIKTPTAAEYRITELLLSNSFGNLNEVQRDVITQMNNSAKFMLDMINNISTLCAFEHDNIRMNFESVEINELIKTCISNLKYQAQDKRCTILFDYAQDEIFVYASKTEITRVIQNLLSNAVNYSYTDRIITATVRIQNGKCQFFVNSYGDKIDEKNINNIFKKYTSINKTGNGLGLYICNLILEKHNCKMFVESNKEIGNSFGFEIALAEKAPVGHL